MNPVKYAIYIMLAATGAGVLLPHAVPSAKAALDIGQQGTISFVSGGVGEDERQEITTLAPAYALELLFARQGTPNEFLADIKVRIMDGSGNTVLDAVSQGPFLLAKVPQRVVFVW